MRFQTAQISLFDAVPQPQHSSAFLL